MAEHWSRYSFRRTRVEGSLSDDTLRAQFALIDTDSSGFIEAGELEQAVRKWAADTGQAVPQHEEMLEFADLAYALNSNRPVQSLCQALIVVRIVYNRHDGRISFAEFAKVMRYVPPAKASGSLDTVQAGPAAAAEAPPVNMLEQGQQRSSQQICAKFELCDANAECAHRHV